MASLLTVPALMELTRQLPPENVELNAGDVPTSLAEDRRTSLLEGLDETSLILRHEAEIDEFQARLRADQPWVFQAETGRKAG